jgi:hypothetical protein
MLVELLSRTVKKLYSEFGSRSKVVRDIIDVLFDVLSIVGYPKSIDDAKIFIEEYLALEPNCAAATAAFHQVNCD